MNLETNANAVLDNSMLTFPNGSVVAITPAIDESFWLFRVRLSDKQAVVAFPKFFTLGIGFQREKDWNTNLPYSCDTEEIYNHIKHNKGDKAIRKADCLEAIKLLQSACKSALEKETKQ